MASNENNQNTNYNSQADHGLDETARFKEKLGSAPKSSQSSDDNILQPAKLVVGGESEKLAFGSTLGRGLVDTNVTSNSSRPSSLPPFSISGKTNAKGTLDRKDVHQVYREGQVRLQEENQRLKDENERLKAQIKEMEKQNDVLSNQVKAFTVVHKRLDRHSELFKKTEEENSKTPANKVDISTQTDPVRDEGTEPEGHYRNNLPKRNKNYTYVIEKFTKSENPALFVWDPLVTNEEQYLYLTATIACIYEHATGKLLTETSGEKKTPLDVCHFCYPCKRKQKCFKSFMLEFAEHLICFGHQAKNMVPAEALENWVKTHAKKNKKEN